MDRARNVSRPKRLFIEELERPASAAVFCKGEWATTEAVGEEAGKGDYATTLAVGEECLKA